ncbi:hypothetical protein GCM10007231_28120 [Nocardioides daphniae]|uniref:Uncharacterized protein n=1 Tax=Nocardioides daphniae TaxID=402297 RepID=A0ABQ1QIZ3_9ACTN|nr:hypothetical protein GCM10007231_28120 [Nocardioides daphniae]
MHTGEVSDVVLMVLSFVVVGTGLSLRYSGARRSPNLWMRPLLAAGGRAVAVGMTHGRPAWWIGLAGAEGRLCEGASGVGLDDDLDVREDVDPSLRLVVWRRGLGGSSEQSLNLASWRAATAVSVAHGGP